MTTIQAEIQEKSVVLKEAEEYYSSVQEENNEISSKLTMITNRMAKIETKLPKLDEEKKVAASTKNFKEAGRLNTKIKAHTAENEANSNQLINLKATKENNEEELVRLAEEKAGMEAEISVLKEKLAEVRSCLLGQKEQTHLE